MAKDFMKALLKIEGAVADREDPFNHVLRTASPSVNAAFGAEGWGLPIPYTTILYGPPGGGKSVLANSFIGQMHKDDPDGWALKYNTEFREQVQLTPLQMQALYGIDPDRYVCFEANAPELIFDKIETDVVAQIQEGLPLRMVIIDSIMGIMGRRMANAESVLKQQIGDRALTLGDGFKRILALQRKYKFAVILTDHVRAELDQAEQMRGNTLKMGSSWAVQHYAEFFMFVEQLKTKEGRSDALGNEFVDPTVVDAGGKSEKTGFKTRVTMKKSSIGTAGRTGIFTFDYKRGFINTHEEVFDLATDLTNVIEQVGHSYVFRNEKDERKWVGKPAMLKALEQDPHLCKEVLDAVRKADFEKHRAIQK